MTFIAALLTYSADQRALRQAAAGHEIVTADSWRGLARTIRHHPIAAAVADPHAEARKDGALRIYRLRESFPHTPIIAWGELDGRDLYRLGKAGATDVVFTHDTTNTPQVAEIIDRALALSMPKIIEPGLRENLEEEALEIILFAAAKIPHQFQVPDIAAAFETSVSTLERRCERCGIPTPGRLLLWLRVLHGLYWLAEPGRSLESVADQLGYSSGAAFRRAVQATNGGRGGPPRTYRSFHVALTRFLAECSGTTPHHAIPHVPA